MTLNSLYIYVINLLVFLSRASEVNQQSDCGESFRYQNSPVGENFAQLLTNSTYLTQIYGRQDKKFLHQPEQLYYINTTIPDDQFIICITPKSGSIRFKLLLYKVLNKDKVGKFSKDAIRYRELNPLKFQTQQKINELISNPKMKRYQIVRNPYIRAISMFESKLKNSNGDYYKKGLGISPEKNLNFEEFIQILYDRWQIPTTDVSGYIYTDMHFQPQSKLCKVHLGMSFNYIMKMEEMNDWYDCFVDAVNIRDDVMHGWPDKDNCYFSTTKNPCNGPVQQDGLVVQDHRFFHYKNRNNETTRIQQYYQNRTILKMVTKMYQSDFETYNYQKLV